MQRLWHRAAIIALVATGCADAFAAGILPLDAHRRALLVQQGRMGELQLLESEQRRLQFQQERQRHREQERETMRFKPPQLEVPRMRRNCQLQPNGSNFLPNCR